MTIFCVHILYLRILWCYATVILQNIGRYLATKAKPLKVSKNHLSRAIICTLHVYINHLFKIMRCCGT